MEKKVTIQRVFGLMSVFSGGRLKGEARGNSCSRVTRFVESSRDVAANAERGGAEPPSTGVGCRSLAEGTRRSAFPGRVTSAPAVRHVRQPSPLLVGRRALRTGRYLDLPWVAGVRALHGKAISARTRVARPLPSRAVRARCDEGYLSLTAPGLRAAMRALGRGAQPTGSGASCTGAARSTVVRFTDRQSR